MFFDTWYGLVRVIVVGVLAYVALIAVLRTTGKRTLSKLNAFDLVVTVALGSCLATVVLSKDIALVEGVVAFALLAGLQYAVAWASLRGERIRDAVKSSPALLFYRGVFHTDVLRRERITESEIRGAVRAHGFATMEDVEAVVLETAGELSVIGRAPLGIDRSAMQGVAAESGSSQVGEALPDR